MREDYRRWLEKQGYDAGTITAQLQRVGRIEKYYGDLDTHFKKDELQNLTNLLKFSADDQRQGRPNPTKIPIDGDLRSNLASYRSAIEFYKKFLRDPGIDLSKLGETLVESAQQIEADVESQRIGLERDLQVALRRNISDLEAGLEIIDRGVERSVPSGRVDITALDSNKEVVVIELKAGTAGRNAVAQILSYMGDIAAMDPSRMVRGILVAADFDPKAVASARVVPSLTLKRYSVRFTISDA